MDCLQKFKSITKRKQSCEKPQVILPKPETKYELVEALKYHKRNVDICVYWRTQKYPQNQELIHLITQLHLSI